MDNGASAARYRTMMRKRREYMSTRGKMELARNLNQYLSLKLVKSTQGHLQKRMTSHESGGSGTLHDVQRQRDLRHGQPKGVENLCEVRGGHLVGRLQLHLEDTLVGLTSSRSSRKVKRRYLLGKLSAFHPPNADTDWTDQIKIRSRPCPQSPVFATKCDIKPVQGRGFRSQAGATFKIKDRAVTKVAQEVVRPVCLILRYELKTGISWSVRTRVLFDLGIMLIHNAESHV